MRVVSYRQGLEESNEKEGLPSLVWHEFDYLMDGGGKAC